MTVLSPIPVALVASINEYLARRIYAVGWSDGYFASVEGERGMRP